ncbi:MAG: nucleotidyltransferase domain-containing protein [Acidobacteriota bacterium]
MKSIALRDKDIEALCGALSRFPSVQEVRVFGSRATGSARRASDLDLAISAPNATAEEWADLFEALEQAPIIYELDLVRLDQTANARLLEKIEREGITVYPEELRP